MIGRGLSPLTIQRKPQDDFEIDHQKECKEVSIEQKKKERKKRKRKTSIVKKLWDAKHILLYWVSNGSIRVKFKDKTVSTITHDCNLENLFPDNSLIDNC